MRTVNHSTLIQRFSHGFASRGNGLWLPAEAAEAKYHWAARKKLLVPMVEGLWIEVVVIASFLLKLEISTGLIGQGLNLIL